MGIKGVYKKRLGAGVGVAGRDRAVSESENFEWQKLIRKGKIDQQKRKTKLGGKTNTLPAQISKPWSKEMRFHFHLHIHKSVH